MSAILITGNIQTGKSTLVFRVLQQHPEWRIGGFRTVSVPAADGWMTLHLLPGDPEIGVCSKKNQVGKRNPVAHCREAIPAAFDRLCEKVFDTADVDLLLMDELGGMEEDAEVFKHAVLQTLRGPVPVLGVIKPKDTPFLNDVRSCPGVELIRLDEQNRDKLVSEVEQKLAALMRSRI